MALCLGLCLGLGVAWLRDTLDDRVRGVNDLEAQAGIPVLGVLPAFRSKKHSPADRLVVVRNPDSRVAEAYRNLRTRLLQVMAWQGADTLLVTSPGREEKTTVAANLSATLAALAGASSCSRPISGRGALTSSSAWTTASGSPAW